MPFIVWTIIWTKPYLQIISRYLLCDYTTYTSTTINITVLIVSSYSSFRLRQMNYLQMIFEIFSYGKFIHESIDALSKERSEISSCGKRFLANTLSPFARVSSICNVVDLQVQTACIVYAPFQLFQEVLF